MLWLDLGRAGLGVLLGALLLWVHHSFRKAYLRPWAWSWWSFAASRLAAAGAAWRLSPPLGVLSSCLAGLAVGWLLAGAAELWRGTPITGRPRLALLLGPAAIGLGTALAPAAAVVEQVQLAVLGFGFLAAAWTVHRSKVWPVGIGTRLVSTAFVLLAATQVIRAMVETPQLPAVSVLGLLLEAAVGFGMVAGLLEGERARTGRALAEVERLAYHDTSTDLPNRRMLLDRIGRECARAKRSEVRLVVAHLDVDRFKDVNEAWSTAVGDAVLRGVGDRLRGLLREGDVVARLGGDSFALLLTGLDSDEQVLALTDRIARRIGRPFVLHEREIELTASIGVSWFPEHGTDAETLLSHADAAMYRAKEAGRNRTLFYQPTMTSRAGERLGLERALRRALGGDQLALHYQPIVELTTGRVVRFEALLRWPHPEKGLLSPDDFLPLIEPMGLTAALDQWVLRTACTEALTWRRATGARPPQVAVNLSTKSLQQATLVQRVDTVLADTGLPAQALELEITESGAMEDAEATLVVLRQLKALGVHLAIDDFGTGYSSLSYLRTFPIDTLKIDRAFVRDLGVQSNARALIAAIIALARSLGLAVVAEGIELPEQRQILLSEGCQLVQGYLVGMPMPAAECARWLAHRSG